MGRRMMTVAEVAAAAGVSESAIHKLHNRGRMPKGELVPADHGGHQLLWPKAAIDRWLPTRASRGRPKKSAKR